MELNKYIDHTNLKANATLKDIEKLCNEAIENHFETVCVNPYYVPLAKELLKSTNVGITTVVGFPLGMNTMSVKEYEAIDAINNGATEIDMVINIGAVKDKDYEYVKEEIEHIRDSIDGHILKVIIETCYLEKEEIIKLTEICNETFVNFIKTSTGFGTRGASLEDIEIIKAHKNDILEIKASGKIKTEEELISFIEAGATRIGTSHAVEILNEHQKCDCKKGEC
jgi:deoxyribose-phosphate aldolase